MPDLFDYLAWRGDLTLDCSPFNRVDSLILCALCYIGFEDVVPSPAAGGSLPVNEAAERFFALRAAPLPRPDTRDFKEHNLLLLDALSRAPRFASLPLSGYVSKLESDEVVQFSALTIGLGGGEGYVAFRGTDSTLVGWKEDFNMAFLPTVPSQQEAADYLADMAGRFSSLRVGGHSKGGNLAVYAAAHCPRQETLNAVYNNDGPGFSSGLFATPAYQNIRERVQTYVPQSSVVGMLLDHEESYAVVRSAQVGILQHNPYSWQVLGADFIRLDTVTGGSRFLDLTLREWLSGMDTGRRAKFVDALFEVLGASNAATTAELSADWLRSTSAALQALRGLDEESRSMLGEVLRLLLNAARKAMPTILPRRKDSAAP